MTKVRARRGLAGRARRRPQQQPQAEGQQQRGDEEAEDVRAWDGEHADHRAEDPAGEEPLQAARPVVAQQRAGTGHDVVEEVGGVTAGLGTPHVMPASWKDLRPARTDPGSPGRRSRARKGL
ncbi:hypothetical protein ACFCYM_05650 [Streptomyces sp. NPDC056254]|uniref:hypothetical protein n=1 Tax=Streptomyces sp. NPDC056254 TaxID=3345763 RepID=UPI0035E2021F